MNAYEANAQIKALTRRLWGRRLRFVVALTLGVAATLAGDRLAGTPGFVLGLALSGLGGFLLNSGPNTKQIKAEIRRHREFLSRVGRTHTDWARA